MSMYIASQKTLNVETITIVSVPTQVRRTIREQIQK